MVTTRRLFKSRLSRDFPLTRDQVLHLETAANLCASRPEVKDGAIEVEQRYMVE